MVHLTSRLLRVAELIEIYCQPSRRLADIGSDHALLPIYLVGQGSVDQAIAGEVVEGPYQAALKAVRQAGLSDKIQVRLGDGLEVIQPQDQVNVISICGMGGSLIRDILASDLDRIQSGTTLVLQANIANRLLRHWLVDHGFQLIDEDLVGDKQHIYQIQVASYQPDLPRQALSDQDLYFGPYLINREDELFQTYWTKEAQQLERIYQQINLQGQSSQEQATKLTNIEKELNWIKERIQ